MIRQTHILQYGSQHIWLKVGGGMQVPTETVSLYHSARNLYVLKYLKVSIFISLFGDP